MFATMALKSIVISLPRKLIPFRKRVSTGIHPITRIITSIMEVIRIVVWISLRMRTNMPKSRAYKHIDKCVYSRSNI